MIKKILLVLVSVLVFVSCSNNTTSPDSSNNGNNSGVTPPTVDKEEEELIKKYGIDISQEDGLISQQIEQNLRQQPLSIRISSCSNYLNPKKILTPSLRRK